MDKYHIVYRTVEPTTGKYYFGKHSTSNIDDGYCGSGRWVIEEKAKGTWLETEILSLFESAEEAFAAEEEIISKHWNDPFCMNLVTNARPPVQNGPLSEERRKNISREKTGLKFSPTHCENMSLARKGKRLGEDNHFYGKSHSDDTKQKIRESLKVYHDKRGRKPAPEPKKRKLSPEAVEAMRKRMIGKKQSDETKARRSESIKEAWATGIKKIPHPVTCPHCGKTGNPIVMPRWHLDNCKEKR